MANKVDIASKAHGNNDEPQRPRQSGRSPEPPQSTVRKSLGNAQLHMESITEDWIGSHREHANEVAIAATFCTPQYNPREIIKVRYGCSCDDTMVKGSIDAGPDQFPEQHETYDQELCIYHDMQSHLDDETPSWKPVALVNGKGLVRTRRYPTKVYRAEGEYLIPAAASRGLDVELRTLPFESQIISTQHPPEPQQVPQYLKLLVEKTLPTWEDCINAKARERLRKASARAARDEEVSGNLEAWNAHRVRAAIGTRAGEVRIGPDEYHQTVLKVLADGYTLKISPQGKPTVREWNPAPSRRWGFKAHTLREDALEIDWPDKELIFSLKWGFRDFSDLTPPLCSFSPHQKKALTSGGEFQKAVQKEVDLGWISDLQGCPTSIPFRVQPGSVEDKKDGSKRLVWNASWPKPGTLASSVSIGYGPWSSISSNANTTVPQEMLTEWTAIESNNEMISIMAAGAKFSGLKLFGRTYDLKKWFRQLAVADVELWKCGVHVLGGYREDLRMQMGRSASAHSAQRVSILLVHLLHRAAQSEKWGVKGDLSSKELRLKEWMERRARHTKGLYQDRAVAISVFQDDLTVIAIGERAASDAEEGIPRISEGRYGIELSRKEEANKPFAQSFSSIGAAYNLQVIENIECRPTDGTEKKYRLWAAQLNEQAGKLVPFEELEKFIGLHQFMARFLEDGQQLCNSAYACLKAGYEIATARQLAPYSREFRADVQRILSRLEKRELPPISRDPTFLHPGLLGACSDASGGCNQDGRGWGVCVMGAMAYGEWCPQVQMALREEAISISPLELLGAAIALDVGYKAGKLPRDQAIVLRNDNESACAVANSGRAGSAPMREALKVFTKVKRTIGIKVRLQHIKGEKNVIADHLSRGRKEDALQAARSMWAPKWYDGPKELPKWAERIVKAGREAKRRSQQVCDLAQAREN